MTPVKHQVKIFLAHAKENDVARARLDSHLSIMKRSGHIQTWHEGAIKIGSKWDESTREAFDSSDIVILIVSVDFIASDYFYDLGVYKAIERHKNGDAHIIPFILDHCAWRDTPLGKIQPFPRDGNPVSDWPNFDKALTLFVNDLKHIVKNIKERKKSNRKKEERLKETIEINVKDLEKLVEHNSRSRNRIYVNELDLLKKQVEYYRKEVDRLRRDNNRLSKLLAARNKNLKDTRDSLQKTKVKIKIDERSPKKIKLTNRPNNKNI